MWCRGDAAEGNGGFPRIRDVPVDGALALLWSTQRWHCEEPRCPRLLFFESTAQVVSETAAAIAVS
ncbi:MAG: hypothetical protein ABWY04_06865 [Arthrobacter sp.]